ncbi:hypothetical protein D3C85_876890 [compost metagenome]
MVEHIFAVGMVFHIRGQGGQQLAPIIDGQAMGRLPARALADTAAAFKGTEERMAQERLRTGHQGIPGGGIEVGKMVERQDLHVRSLNVRAGEKKPRAGRGSNGGRTDG